MDYGNKNLKTILAMENARLKDDYYGEDYDYYDNDMNACPCCGALYPRYFFMNDDQVCVGCELCLTMVSERF